MNSNNNPQQFSNIEEDEISLIDIVFIFKRHQRKIIWATIIVFFFTFLYTFYESCRIGIDPLHIHILPRTSICIFLDKFIDNLRCYLHWKFDLNRHFTFKDICFRAH